VGDVVGLVGLAVGGVEGDLVTGLLVGAKVVGEFVGTLVGDAVGLVGLAVGGVEGAFVGLLTGFLVGLFVGGEVGGAVASHTAQSEHAPEAVAQELKAVCNPLQLVNVSNASTLNPVAALQ